VADDALSLIQKRAAAFGHLDAALGAAKQWKADLILQELDLLADGGLGDIETDRRLGEAALLGNGERVSDLAKVHCRSRSGRVLLPLISRQTNFGDCQLSRTLSKIAIRITYGMFWLPYPRRCPRLLLARNG
jgi:hypothetical protein